MTSPNPSSAESELKGVSCASTTSCSAVGYYADGSAYIGLVEHWNGASWSIVTSPNPSGSTFTELVGVSCPSTTSCFAVGDYTSSSSVIKTLVEHWNGTSWSIVTSPNPTGSTITVLSGVSCPSTTSCFAVGDQENSSSLSATLVEHWNGTSWSIVTSPNPSGSTFTELVGVSCPSTTSCFAVGDYETSSAQKTLAEQWNGTSWAIVTSPNPTGATGPVLTGVACPSTTSCFAVGDYQTSGAGYMTLVEQWNGTSWAIVTSPNPTGSLSTILNGAWCLSAASCFAVGTYYGGSAYVTLVEHWNGTSWTVVAPPSGSSQSQLAQVACPSTTSCYAVGSYFDGSTTKTLVEHWNGTSWSIVTSPNPSGATGSSLNGVSCPSTTSCYAVGSYSNSSTTKTLVERWNGTSWAIVANPNPTGSTSAYLNSVSCPSTTSCYAVGSYSNSATTKTLVERWNGTSWTIVGSPNPTDGSTTAILSDVACPSTTSCYAAGEKSTSSTTKTLAEHWNGTSWAIVTSPNPSGATGSSLNGVSCPNTTSCWAVGNYSTSSVTKTLVERWNGTSWAIVGSPNPTDGSTTAILSGVACPSTTSCYAVGEKSTSSTTKTLVEQWNGTSWAIVGSPNPSGAAYSFLNGVSCPSTANCYAVGNYSANASDYTLIERYA